MILKALRLSATPNTRLILLENIVPYAVAGPEQNTPGDKAPVPPAPFLPNLGVVNLSCYIAGMHVRERQQLLFAIGSVSRNWLYYR